MSQPPYGGPPPQRGWEPPGYVQPGPGSQPVPQQHVSPQPAPAHPPAQSQLVVNLRKPFGLLSDQMISPLIRINGYPAPARWGPNFFPTPAGPHQIVWSSRYLWEFGPQTMHLDIPPGQSVEVHYSGPMVTFGSGRMGFTEQPRPGFVVWIVLISIPVALLLILLIGVLVTALAG